ncbi:MAG TPA: hypothetical protein VMR62_12795 [Bryobacteraceae bacterium]|nr:hypothetical protein [Bryobacteraceae bacterium]
MNLALVERIANAVLYEGYMLYPYRPSARKNQRRFNFGVLVPPAYSARESNETSGMRTECLVLGSGDAALDVRVKFLQVEATLWGRTPVLRPTSTSAWGLHDSACEGRVLEDPRRTGVLPHEEWREAVEREVRVADCRLGSLAAEPRREAFNFPPLAAEVEIGAVELEPSVYRASVQISNLTNIGDLQPQIRDEILPYSLASTHTILAVTDGEFVSLIDPPDHFRAAAAQCRNIGAWPVLAGEPGARDAMLSSPIILYDYPQVAQESPGDLFDGAEIDEILTLRILTMTDEEKREMLQAGDRARHILERTESLPEEQFMKLHGALRGLGPSTTETS